MSEKYYDYGYLCTGTRGLRHALEILRLRNKLETILASEAVRFHRNGFDLFSQEDRISHHKGVVFLTHLYRCLCEFFPPEKDNLLARVPILADASKNPDREELNSHLSVARPMDNEVRTRLPPMPQDYAEAKAWLADTLFHSLESRPRVIQSFTGSSTAAHILIAMWLLGMDFPLLLTNPDHENRLSIRNFGDKSFKSRFVTLALDYVETLSNREICNYLLWCVAPWAAKHPVVYPLPEGGLFTMQSRLASSSLRATLKYNYNESTAVFVSYGVV